MTDEAKPKSSYQVLAPLKVADKRLDPIEGKVIKVDLTDDEAAELKAAGVVGDLPAKPAKEKTETKEAAKDKGAAKGPGATDQQPAA
jgi:hypothetical protein